MNEVSVITANTPLNRQTNVISKVNFQAVSKPETEVDTFVKEQEKARKKAERAQIFNYAVLGTIGLASLGSLAIMGHQMGWFKKFKLDFKDLNSEKALKDMALPESQVNAAKRISFFIVML